MQHWAKIKITPYFIHRRAVSFILDSTFKFTWQFEKCVKFIHQTYNELKSNDWFSVCNLGDQIYNIILEEKTNNYSVKQHLLRALVGTVENYFMERREQDLSNAISDALMTMETTIPVQKVHHRSLSLKGPNRWVICLLGSLRKTHHLEWATADPDINLIIVAVTDEVLENEHVAYL